MVKVPIGGRKKKLYARVASTDKKIAQRSPQEAETTSTASRNANPAVLALACRRRQRVTSTATRAQEDA